MLEDKSVARKAVISAAVVAAAAAAAKNNKLFPESLRHAQSQQHAFNWLPYSSVLMLQGEFGLGYYTEELNQ